MSFKKTEVQKKAIELLGSDARNVALWGGSRSGKTLILLYALAVRSLKTKSTHCVIRRTFKDCRQKIGLTSFPQMMNLCLPGIPYDLNRQDWFVDFPNGSRLWLAGLDDTAERDQRILGQEFSTLFFNECPEIVYDSVLIAQTRLAEKNELKKKSYFDANPTVKRHWLYKLFIEHIDPIENTKVEENHHVSLRMNPRDNLENIDVDYIKLLESMPAKKRKRFLDGEFAEDVDGKLWKEAWINGPRVIDIPNAFERIVIGVDPAVTSKEQSDLTGIVVCGKLGDDFYVLDDCTMKATPNTWARTICELFVKWGADAVVAEVNQGGDLVESNIHNYDNSVNVIKVRAKRGKFLRAEPISALYERSLVHHFNVLQELEDEMIDFEHDNKHSPNHVDALVWALTELAGMELLSPRVAGSEKEVKKPLKELTVAEIVDREEIWSDFDSF